MREATLCHPLREGQLLLVRKQRGPGAGNLVAPGGKLEGDETPRECAIRETREEAIPHWIDTDDLPYEEMWDDDRYWLPLLLDGERFRGEFYFDSDGEDVLEYDLETDVEF